MDIKRNGSLKSRRSSFSRALFRLDIIVKTLLNNLWTHIGYEADGHLLHTDKRTGMQFVSVKRWPNLVAARQALDFGFSKIEWEELKDLPPGA